MTVKIFFWCLPHLEQAFLAPATMNMSRTLESGDVQRTPNPPSDSMSLKGRDKRCLSHTHETIHKKGKKSVNLWPFDNLNKIFWQFNPSLIAVILLDFEHLFEGKLSMCDKSLRLFNKLCAHFFGTYHAFLQNGNSISRNGQTKWRLRSAKTNIQLEVQQMQSTLFNFQSNFMIELMPLNCAECVNLLPTVCTQIEMTMVMFTCLGKAIKSIGTNGN